MTETKKPNRHFLNRKDSKMRKRDAVKMANSIIKAMGGKTITVKIETPKLKCRARGCGGEVRTDRVVSFYDPYSGVFSHHFLILAHWCKDCGRIHGRKGKLIKTFRAGEKVFLDRRTGEGVVKNRRGKEVLRFWTSAVKPSKKKPKSILIK